MSTPPLKMGNSGPKSAAWLRQVGLRTPEDLAEAGPLEAFMRVKRAGFQPSLTLLYALEGALQDCHWQETGRAHVRTPVPNAHLVCRLLRDKKKDRAHTSTRADNTNIDFYP